MNKQRMEELQENMAALTTFTDEESLLHWLKQSQHNWEHYPINPDLWPEDAIHTVLLDHEVVPLDYTIVTLLALDWLVLCMIEIEDSNVPVAVYRCGTMITFYLLTPPIMAEIGRQIKDEMLEMESALEKWRAVGRMIQEDK